ncbi:hypothetical protein DBZ45_04565 [Arthrobacter globiformis]|uniref:Uncharacterized protein n=1 Tax=Arthrobacter globiformis TaxID=1665 RepID=A0A328HID4_ARTGO|nr:hypothetical protein DBZ45_04565 [Arthrobacter globiformis]
MVPAARPERPARHLVFHGGLHRPNQRNLGRQQLIDSLDDVPFGLRDAYGGDKFPRQAAEYLDDWAAPERAWLRKYYIQG